MQLTKTEEEHYQSIDYFVREKLRKGTSLTSSELWAKEWMDLHAQSYKRPEEVFYKTYHTIPKCVQVWEERMNLKPSIPKEKKAKTYALKFEFEGRAKELLEKNRYKTLIPLENLKAEEYQMICGWFEEGKVLPDYLQGVVKPKLSVKEVMEKFFSQSIEQALTKTQNVVFYAFLCFFLMMLMFINL